MAEGADRGVCSVISSAATWVTGSRKRAACSMISFVASAAVVDGFSSTNDVDGVGDDPTVPQQLLHREAHVLAGVRGGVVGQTPVEVPGEHRQHIGVRCA